METMEKIPENEGEACKLFRELLNEANKRGRLLNVWKILPEGEEVSINLSSKRYRDFWSKWWGDKDIPQLEIDILIVLDEETTYKIYGTEKSLGRPTLLGVEVKYFREDDGKNFYEGIDQATVYFIVGIDKTALLHLFHPSYSEDRARIHAKTAETLVKGLELPIAYVACKLLGNGNFRVYSTYYYSSNVSVEEVFHYLR